MFDLMKYYKPYFYGGELADLPEVRLIKAVIIQAAVDTTSDNDNTRQEAIKFFEGRHFKLWCKLLEGVYL